MTNIKTKIQVIRDTESQIEILKSKAETARESLLAECGDQFKKGMTQNQVIEKLQELGLDDPKLAFSLRLMSYVRSHLPGSEAPLDSMDIQSLRSQLANFLIEATSNENY
ncbi:hypothetical protein [Vibrio harveyi]|uniref:hypothetical protein n=1 Tax=Vibrio harveyi TaxID=669 RepID=UPI003CEDCCC5